MNLDSLFRTKSVDRITRKVSDQAHLLKRTPGWQDPTMLGIGNLIDGTGILNSVGATRAVSSDWNHPVRSAGIGDPHSGVLWPAGKDRVVGEVFLESMAASRGVLRDRETSGERATPTDSLDESFKPTLSPRGALRVQPEGTVCLPLDKIQPMIPDTSPNPMLPNARIVRLPSAMPVIACA